MVLAMSRPYKHPKTGIYWFRKRVPAHLVAIIGRREITQSLETRDPAEAKQRHSEVTKAHETRWATVRAGSQDLTERQAHGIAVAFYAKWMDQHRDNPSLEVLWNPDFYKELWTFTPLAEDDPEPGVSGTRPMENIVIPAMRQFCLVQADYALEHFGHENNLWNRLIVAKATAAAMQRAHLVLQRQAEGYFEPGDSPPHPWETARRPSSLTSTLAPVQRATVRRDTGAGSLSLKSLFDGWWQEAKAAGRKPSTYESYRNTFAGFGAFLGHDDAGKITRDDVVRFKEHRLTSPSPKTGKVVSAKTVKESDLSALKAVFEWAVSNGKLPDNPAAKITVKLTKPPKLRGKGFTDLEAEAILSMAMAHKGGKEHARTSAAKRWVPWLCAFTGARVGELAQLRKQDVTKREQWWVIRITPEAGTVKTNEAREIVLHPQLVSLGFPEFVAASSEGHLFLTASPSGDVLGPLQGLKNRLVEFVRGVVKDSNVAPNHGWRHRFKTVGMEAGIPPRILDAIQGQAPRSVADTYGDVTLKTIAAEVVKLPWIDLPYAQKER